MRPRFGIASVATIGLLALPSHAWSAQSLDPHHVMVWTGFEDGGATAVRAMAQDRDGALWLGLPHALAF